MKLTKEKETEMDSIFPKQILGAQLLFSNVLASLIF